MAATMVRERDEIPERYTFDRDSIFESREAWDAAVTRLRGMIPTLEGFRGRLDEGPETLRGWFAARDEALGLLGRVVVYASLARAVNTRDAGATAMDEQARSLASELTAVAAFEEPELLEIGHDTLLEWIEVEPALAARRHTFDVLERRRAHVRSPEIEQLLGQLRNPFYSATRTHGLLVDTDLEFEPATASDGERHPITQGNIRRLLADEDRALRRSAYEIYADTHLDYRNTIANVLATGVKQHVFTARARRYESSLEAALSPVHVPTEVFHNLIETFRRHLPIWHRYWALRRRALGVETLHPYDIKAPLTERSLEIPYEQAVEWVVAGLAPLGDEYLGVARLAMTAERWVDVYPNLGKRSGAFSSGAPGTRPFIIMSYNDDIFGLSTLAHEMGHSMHSYYSWKRQPLHMARYTIFLAEVASNFNQVLVRAHLLERNDDPEFQITVLEEAMSNFHRYFFIMPTLARFELEIHERVERGVPLTADGMIALLADLFEEGYGGEVTFDREREGIGWAQFPLHMYMNFYVFQYATGISGAHALGQRVLAGEPGAREAYIEFLSAGGSDYPMEILRRAGVDLTSTAPVEAAFEVLAGYVDQLEHALEARDARSG